MFMSRPGSIISIWHCALFFDRILDKCQTREYNRNVLDILCLYGGEIQLCVLLL